MTTNATVTLLFTDLVDATGLLGRLGEDDAQAVRRTHFQLLRDAVAAHGGHEVKSLGDGLMVVFQSAVDAVSAAVAMAQAVERHNRRNPTTRVDVKLGLNVGEPTREGDDYFGLPVVLAKRLCDTADPGQILVSDVVRALVGARISQPFQAVEPRELKGVGLTALYEVAWEAPRPAAAELPSALVPPADGCFVGRERELDRLRLAWKEAAGGIRRAVLIGGEPGVGKTRLAAEVAGEAQRDGSVLYGRCDEDLGVPYQPFAEALRASAAACSDEELARRVGSNGASLVRLVPELRDRLTELPPLVTGEADAERYLLFEAVTEFLATAAEDRPILLVLDDLHWAAKPTLVLLRHLLRSTATMSVLIVGTFRDTELDRAPLLGEALADLRRDADVERMSLSGLDRASVAAFVTCSGYELSAATSELAEAVHAGTEGNPFFVGEVLRHLKESGDVELADVGLPPGVTDVVISRLTRLSAATNQVLTLAAVAGAVFELAVLEPLSELDPDTLLDSLDEAVRARVILELPTVGHYTFAHALIRQVLVGELTASRRARMHWRITEALSALPDASHRVDELAFHSVEAGAVGDVVRAAEYALAASRVAFERMAYEPAAEVAARGVSALSAVPQAHRRVRAELLLALADAGNFAGGNATTKAAARQAAIESASVEWAEGLARASVAYGRWVELGIADPAVETLCEDALAALTPDDLRWRARVLTTLANYQVNGLSRGAEVKDLARECVELARQAGDEESLAWALYLEASTLASTGDIDSRLALAEELVALSRDRDDARGKLDGLVMRAGTRLEIGDMEGFDSEIVELERVASRLQWFAPRWWAGNFRITQANLAGRFEDAEVMADEQFQRGVEDANALSAYTAQLFAARREMGRHGDLEPLIVEGFRANPQLISFQSALIITWADLGRDDEARRELDSMSVDGFAVLPHDVSFTSCISFLSEAAAMLGAPEHAAALDPLLAPHAGRLVVGGVGVACFGAVDRFLGILAACIGDRETALMRYAAAAELESRVASPPALARTRYWWGRLLLGGDPDDAAKGRELLAAAGDTADNLGMTLLSQRVREALGVDN